MSATIIRDEDETEKMRFSGFHGESFMSSNSMKPLSIAPMIQYTDRHWRYLMRMITRKTVLYTEMTMDSALVWNANNLDPFIGHDPIEYPLVLQLGGCDPQVLGEATYLAQSYGRYEEINLNSGCPSNRAKKVKLLCNINICILNL